LSLLLISYKLFFIYFSFFFHVSPSTYIYTLSLHDALPILCNWRRSYSLPTMLFIWEKLLPADPRQICARLSSSMRQLYTHLTSLSFDKTGYLFVFSYMLILPNP